ENAGVAVTGLEIALVAADDPVADVGAAVLNAGVPADDLVLQTQLKVIELSVAPDDERVPVGLIVVGGAARYRAVGDRPELGIAVPAVEARAVEDEFITGLVVGRSHGRSRRQRGDQCQRGGPTAGGAGARSVRETQQVAHGEPQTAV